jgi:outer membrane protein assembly factor BamA
MLPRWFLPILLLLAPSASPAVPGADDAAGGPLLPEVDSIEVVAPAWLDTEEIFEGIDFSEGTSLLEITQGDVYNAVLTNIQNAGYLDSRIEVAWPGWSDETSTVIVSIEPGRRCLRGGMVFVGNTVFTVADLRKQVTISPGETIVPSRLRDIREGIEEQYRRRGYALVSVETRLLPFDEAAPDSVEGIRGVECIITEGPQIRLGAIRVEGLETVRKTVVVREIELEPGDSLDSEVLRRSITAIYSLGLFQDVRFSYEGFEQARDTVDLVVMVTERPYRQLDIGVSFASPADAGLSAFWRHPNVWDNNQRLTIGAGYIRRLNSGGGDRIEPQAIYEEPWLASTRWTGRLSGRYLYLQFPGQEQRAYEAQLSVSRNLTRDLELTLGYALGRNRFRTATPDGGEESSDWATTSRLSAALEHDTRDAVLDPRTGHLLRWEGRLSGWVLGGTDFYRLEGEVRVFKPVIHDLILGWRARAGVVFPYGPDSTIAPDDRFFLGGGSTVRGYAYNALGPEDEDGNPLGGRVVLLGNIEARMRIYGALGLALFLDSGGLWESVEEITARTTGFGIGMGLRFSTPFGPLRLDYGFAPTWVDGLKRGRAYVALGHPF